MSGLMNTTDNMSFKLLDMNKARAEFLASLDVEHEETLIEQRGEIVGLYEKIEELEGTLLETGNNLRSVLDYQEAHGDIVMEDELASILKASAEQKERNSKHLAKIQTRHEQSLFFTSQKVQRLMKDMEAVAAQVRSSHIHRFPSLNTQF
jgi:hypothetical protein